MWEIYAKSPIVKFFNFWLLSLFVKFDENALEIFDFSEKKAQIFTLSLFLLIILTGLFQKISLKTRLRFLSKEGFPLQISPHSPQISKRFK